MQLIPTGAGLCARGHFREQMPVGGPHAEVELKPQLSLRCHANKEKELKSLLAAAQTIESEPHDQFCKLSTCRTSEWTMSAPATKMGLTLAALDFVGMYTWGMGQARV